MSEKEVKNIDLEFKKESEGKVSAVFSVFNSLDSDGDIVLPGSIKSGFKSGSVPMVWAHKWDMPIGKGTIKSDEGKATFEGEFFMDTESGKEAYNIVKNMADMQQWSFGYRVNDAERGKIGEGDEEKDARFLKDLTVFEVSPVLVGANQETYTLAIKSNKELVEDLIDEEKAVLGSSSFGKEPVSEELNEQDAVSPVVEGTEETVEVSDEMPSAEELVANPAKYLKELYKLKEAELQTQEQISEDAPKAFSEQVKDVLAALNDLMVRATAIAMLRAKDGRTLGVKATEALRAVQEDLSDAWVELDQFIENVGTEVVTELEVVEQQPVEDVVEDEDPSDDVEVEEVESSEEPEVESPEAVTDDNSESSDEDFDAEWLEGQALLSDTVDIDISEEDEPVL